MEKVAEAMGQRVVITGTGVISALGKTTQEFWENLKQGKCGISTITAFDTANYKVSLAAEVKDFHPEEYMDRKEARHMDRFCQFAVAAAAEAMAESGLDTRKMMEENDEALYRYGVYVASGIGGIDVIEAEHEKLLNKGPGRVSPFFVPMIISNMAAAYVSMRHGLKGSCICPVTACASSTQAIGEAFRAIKHGYLDVAVVGGAEASITPCAVAGFSNMQALSTATDPDAASLPFDRRRSGFIMGEGAGILVIESLAHAQTRGANIIAEISGYGSTADAYHITSPHPEGEGAAKAMCFAVKEAGLAVTDVDYINAHGTGTSLNDKYETKAIKRAFGDHSKKLMISSTKSMTGHLLGAAGAIEAIALAYSLKDGVIPPTINLQQPDEECDLCYTPNQAVKKDITVGLSNSLGFGGHNGTILLRRYEG